MRASSLTRFRWCNVWRENLKILGISQDNLTGSFMRSLPDKADWLFWLNLQGWWVNRIDNEPSCHAKLSHCLQFLLCEHRLVTPATFPSLRVSDFLLVWCFQEAFVKPERSLCRVDSLWSHRNLRGLSGVCSFRRDQLLRISRESGFSKVRRENNCLKWENTENGERVRANDKRMNSV